MYAPYDEILPDLFFIQRGYLNANHFAWRAKNPEKGVSGHVLIDTGYRDDFDETENHLKNLDIRLQDVDLIVNTHTHCDHMGGNNRIQEISGCGAALHEYGYRFMIKENRFAPWWRYYFQNAEFFSPTIALNDGDMITIGPYEFRVIFTPGHSADGILLFHEKEKLLISSDTLWENDLPVLTERIEGTTALFRWMAALDVMEKLDVTRIYPGHGAGFSDYKGAIERLRKRLSDYENHPEKIGMDLIKKIMVYTLLMKKRIGETIFFTHLKKTPWFCETCDHYLAGEFGLEGDALYRKIYESVLDGFIKRGIIMRDDADLSTSVVP